MVMLKILQRRFVSGFEIGNLHFEAVDLQYGFFNNRSNFRGHIAEEFFKSGDIVRRNRYNDAAC